MTRNPPELDSPSPRRAWLLSVSRVPGGGVAIVLGSEFVPGTTYTVDVNGTQATFVAQ